MSKSKLENQFKEQLRQSGIELSEEQYIFHPTRKWRFDYAFPDQKVAVELHGGTWVQGRHTRGIGFQKDREKMNEAVMLGWRVVEATKEQLEEGMCLYWLSRLLLIELTKTQCEEIASNVKEILDRKEGKKKKPPTKKKVK